MNELKILTFNSYEEMVNYKEPIPGDYAFTNNKFYVYNNEWKTPELYKAPSELQKLAGDLEKITIKASLPLTKEDIYKKKLSLHNFINIYFPWSNYFLLQFKDINYYTIFEKDERFSGQAVNLIIESIEAVGPIITIDDNNSQEDGVVNIWVWDQKNNNEPVNGQLLPFEAGVKKCRFS